MSAPRDGLDGRAPGQGAPAGYRRPAGRGPHPARPPRRRETVEAGRVYLGWQHALLHPDPGPLPRRPLPPPLEQLNQGWVAAQRREENRLARPQKLASAGFALLAAVALALWQAGVLNAALTWLAVAVFAAVSVRGGRAVWRGEQQLRSRVEEEKRRIAKIRAAQQSRQAARLEQHASQYRSWQQRRAAFDRQLQWYAVSLPARIDRVDVAGGTLAGWSAMLTMIAAPRLSAGGEVTVLDLTEGAVASDLLAVARRSGIEPLVWVMPGDLPRLDLGTGLSKESLADVLALAVSATDEPGSAGDPAKDSAILERVLDVLDGDGSGGAGGGASEVRIAQVTAALRALAQVGDPREDLRGGLLTDDQLERITALYGRGATERVVTERAWALESRLRKLEQLGSVPVSLPPSRLRVAWLDRRSGVLGNKVLGTYMAVALTHMLRQGGSGSRWQHAPWQHTLCVLGAEKLRGEVLDRLADACETSGTGLMLAYRFIPEHVKERLGRGNAAVAFMRLGNAQDATVASEQIGTEHRFVLSQLTDTVGTSLTDTAGDSYTSTVGIADSVADSVSVSDTSGSSSGRGRSRHGAFAPFGDFTGTASSDTSVSRGTSDSRSITEGINWGTSWGLSTSKALSDNASLARTSQRSREFLVERHELQQLPPSAVIVTYASAAGRQVVLADANPGIIMLPTATLRTLEETRAAAASAARERAAAAARNRGQPPGSAAVAGHDAAPGSASAPDPAGWEAANLGAPPERLDWRRRR
jgi:hypothetical protein